MRFAKKKKNGLLTGCRDVSIDVKRCSRQNFLLAYYWARRILLGLCHRPVGDGVFAAHDHSQKSRPSITGRRPENVAVSHMMYISIFVCVCVCTKSQKKKIQNNNNNCHPYTAYIIYNPFFTSYFSTALLLNVYVGTRQWAGELNSTRVYYVYTYKSYICLRYCAA